MEEDFSTLTAKVRRLVREGRYLISTHALKDHPERGIAADHILECLKLGSVAAVESREVEGKIRYEGSRRYRWFGEDHRDRVLRLILVIRTDVVVISAAEATEGQAERYRREDKT